MKFTKPSIRKRIEFMDNIRNFVILLVLVYHSAAAYSIITPHWIVHDTHSFLADFIRELFDVFMMPVLFFIAGYFALSSLEKKGAWKFLKDKVKQLLAPWVMAVFIVLPLGLYDQPVKPIRPFWKYWLSYLNSFQIRLRFTETPVGPTTQAIYWFISLLFVFFFIFVLVYTLLHRWRGKINIRVANKERSGDSVLVVFGLFGLLTSVAYFIILLFVPDSSWFTLHMFLEFQVTRLIPYFGCFLLGIYAQSRKWFVRGKPLGSLVFWGPVSIVLAATYFAVGQPVFADTAGTAKLSIMYLLFFAFLRSFLLLSLLVTFISYGERFWNKSNWFDRQLTSTSYNIYLIHFFIIVAIQSALLKWIGGPISAKIAIVFFVALAVSYAISRWVLIRHSRVFAVAIMVLFTFCLFARP